MHNYMRPQRRHIKLIVASRLTQHFDNHTQLIYLILRTSEAKNYAVCEDDYVTRGLLVFENRASSTERVQNIATKIIWGYK